ncbi:MAG: LPS export ABC transporter permease LptF [Solirubrobacterales bacterium]
MSGITRYILRQLVVGTIFVAVALTCVLWLTQSLRFVEMIVNKGLSVGAFLQITVLLLPSFLIVVVPISLFAVVLFTYNKLNSDRELVVMRAVGLSHWALARPALILAGVATVAGYLMTCWIIPESVQSFREMQWHVRNDVTGILLQEGAFNKFGQGLTIYIRSRDANGELLGILVHDKRNLQKPVTLMAERGALVFTETGPRVLMVNGNRQQVTEGTGRLSLLYFDSYTVDLASAAGDNGQRFRDAREMSMTELMQAKQAQLGAKDYRRAKVELHQRLTNPINHIGFALIALACLLTAGFDRRGQTRQVMTAVGLMVMAQAVALGAGNLASANLVFVPLIYLSTLVPVALGAWYLHNPPRLRFPRRTAAPQSA